MTAKIRRRRMQKLVNMLSFAAVFILASNLSAQAEKGMVELTLDGPLFQRSTEAEFTRISPTVGVGYFASDALEIGGASRLLVFSNGGSVSGFTLGIDAKYHFSMNEKTWPFAGIGWNGGFGDLFETGGKNPMQLQGEIGVKFWPMEGGAITFSGFFLRQFPDEIKETSFGINLGILIRLK